MAGVDGIQPPTAGVTEFVRNAQQVGAQRQGVNKPDEEREKETGVVDRADITGNDGVETDPKTGSAQDPKNKEDNKDAADVLEGPPGLPQGPPPPPKTAPGSKVPLFMNTVGTNKQGVQPGVVPPGFPGFPTPGGPTGPGGTPGPVAPPSGNPNDGSAQSAAANMAQMSQTDSLQANQVYWQMYAERQKAMWKIFQLLQDLQTQIWSIISDTAANRAKVMDKIANKWAAVLGGTS